MLSNANALPLGTNSFKKEERGHFEQRTSSKKSSVTLTLVSKNNNRAAYVASSESCEPKRRITRITTKSIPLLQPEHGFCQQNGPKRGPLQDWYPDEKWRCSPFV